MPRAAEVGLDESIGFTQDNLSRRRQSSTLNAHRLIYYVTQKYSVTKAEQLYSVLNRKHFIEGGVLNDRNLLLEAVHEVGGIDISDCEQFLASNRGSAEVLQTVDAVQRLGIHSIPTLLIDGGQYILNGAVTADEIVRVLRSLLDSIIRTGDSRTNEGGERKRVFADILRFDV